MTASQSQAIYSLVSYDSVNRIALIQVEGCAKQTEITIPIGMVQNSAAWNSLLDSEAQKVMTNMNPESETYDPSLVGE